MNVTKTKVTHPSILSLAVEIEASMSTDDAARRPMMAPRLLDQAILL